LRATKKPHLIFWNKIYTSSLWNLGHYVLAENLKLYRVTKKPQLIFWKKISSSIIGEKAGRVLPLSKASSGYTRKNWVGFHIKNIIPPHERRKILSALSCCKQLWKFLVISFFGHFIFFKQGSFDRMLFFKYFSQNGENLLPK